MIGIEKKLNNLTMDLVPFEADKRVEVRKSAGYWCQVCATWHQPHKDGSHAQLEVHSTNKTHTDDGMAVCSHEVAPCHQRLHDVTDDPEELERLSNTVARMAGLDLAQKMLARGVPENRIRRIVEKISPR